MDAGEIVISGERKVHLPRDARVRRSERRAGLFERIVRLGPSARPESASERLEAGVLEIRVPKGPRRGVEPLKTDLPPN